MQTDSNSNYIIILKDSLSKKLAILDGIIECNEKQAKLISAQDIDFEAFDELVEAKEAHISKLASLDKGFQAVYDRVKDCFEKDKDRYRDDILQMQKLIKEIVDKSMSIQTQEARNKENFQSKVSYQKQQKRTSKAVNKVAANYYQNMNKLNALEAQFLDTKK